MYKEKKQRKHEEKKRMKKLIYKCIQCRATHRKHVPGVPSYIEVPTRICKKCMLRMEVYIEDETGTITRTPNGSTIPKQYKRIL